MPVFGMDISKVQELSNGLDREARELSDAIASLTAQLSGVRWTGPDADHFRSEWESRQRQLKATIDGLSRTAVLAREHAGRQDRTSQLG